MDTPLRDRNRRGKDSLQRDLNPLSLGYKRFDPPFLLQSLSKVRNFLEAVYYSIAAQFFASCNLEKIKQRRTHGSKLVKEVYANTTGL